MDKYFTIEVEVSEGERKNFITKVTELFMQKGFIVEREWEGNVELKRPISPKSDGETVSYPWIDKVSIQEKSSGVVVNCSIGNFVWIRNLVLYVSPIFDVVFLIILYFIVRNNGNFFVLPVVAVMMIISTIMFYVMFKKQFDTTIQSLAEEIQNLK